MRKFYLLMAILLWLAGCSGQAGPGPDPSATESPADVRATVVSEADAGAEPLFTFQRRGREEGETLEWRIYPGGRAVALAFNGGQQPVVEETTIAGESVDRLMQDLESVGFFDVASEGPEACCDRFSHVISVLRDGEVNTVAVERVTAQTTVSRLQSLNTVEKFIFDEITSRQS